MADPLQRLVVESAANQDMCVMAGAGTGKTYTLVCRIQSLVLRGLTVRCFSHANVTCDELRSRLEKVGVDAPVSTMHSFCRRLILQAGFAQPPDFDGFITEGARALLPAAPSSTAMEQVVIVDEA